MRMDLGKAAQIIDMICEGVGIRAVERLSKVNRHTILDLLETVGRKCQIFLDTRIRNVSVESVQCDEVFGFVRLKEVNNRLSDPNLGTQYLFLGVDRKSKLILSFHVGKRTGENAGIFMADLKKRIKPDSQVTTDGFQGYLSAMYNAFGSRVHFAQQIKTYFNYGTPNPPKPHTHRRYSPEGVKSVRTLVHIGNPDQQKISTSHVERLNLSARLFQRRLTRLTLGFSKKIENLRFSLAIFICHFNWVRVHSAHSQTPAQAIGLTDHAWTIRELLENL